MPPRRDVCTMLAMQRTKRTSSVVTGLLLTAGFVAVGLPAGDAGANAPLKSLRDGNWSGTMAIGATADFSRGNVGLIASGSGNGRFSLLLTGGVASGDFRLDATGSSNLEASGANGQATAAGVIVGELQGTSVIPILTPQAAHFDVSGSVTVNGFNQPFNVPVDAGPEELTQSNLVITSSSCTFASGTWAQEMKAAVQAAGANVTSFRGSWAARFTGAGPAAPDDALTNLLNRGEAVLTKWIADGTFDEEEMESVLVESEQYAVSSGTNDACPGGQKGTWSSPLAGMVERLLTAIANSPTTTAEILRFGVAAGMRTGVLPSIDSPLESTLQAKAVEVYNAAFDANDTFSIQMILISALSLQWTELAQAATEALQP